MHIKYILLEIKTISLWIEQKRSRLIFSISIFLTRKKMIFVNNSVIWPYCLEENALHPSKHWVQLQHVVWPQHFSKLCVIIEPVIMMGTLKNFLRKSPFRDKTLVKSNKFYVRGEGVKLFERKVALVKAVQTGRSESSESVMESFKSIISSTECAENCNNNMDLFKHELEEFTKPPEDTSQGN